MKCVLYVSHCYRPVACFNTLKWPWKNIEGVSWETVANLTVPTTIGTTHDHDILSASHVSLTKM